MPKEPISKIILTCLSSVSDELKQKANELAKNQVLRQFFMIGILEQFVDTLQIFQRMLPAYYSGVIDIWNSDCK